MKLEPLLDYILIDVDSVKNKTESGLLLSSNVKELPPLGTITGVGPDVKHLKVGDRVIFARYAARYTSEDVTDERPGERLVHESDCWAKVIEE